MKNYLGQLSLTSLLQMIKDYVDSSFSGVSGFTRTDVEISTDSSSIDIPIRVKNLDNLMVYQNGVLLSNNFHYTVADNKVKLKDYVAPKGSIFTFIEYN